MADKQTDGRKENGAVPGDKPDAATSAHNVTSTGQKEKRSAGPDGPDAKEIGDTFKKPGA